MNHVISLIARNLVKDMGSENTVSKQSELGRLRWLSLVACGECMSTVPCSISQSLPEVEDVLKRSTDNATVENEIMYSGPT